jgi:hypothetical protein
VLLIVISAVALRSGDLAATVICFGCGIASLLYGLFTRLRVRRGYFGSNPAEALEIIGYIVEHFHETGKPPGARVSHPYKLDEKPAGASVHVVPEVAK